MTSKNARLPNAIAVGAPRSGTTSLYHYLAQHPDIFLPERKELHYFSYPLLRENSAGPGDAHALRSACATAAAYAAQYQGVNGERIVAEVSPSYLYYAGVAEKIRATLGDVKIVILLRDPVEKAFSQYMHLVREGREALSFAAALKAEPERRAAQWGDMWRYAESSLYAARVQAYRRVFGAENVFVGLSEHFFGEPQAFLRNLLRFLDVDDSLELDVGRLYNRSGVPRSRRFARLISGESALKPLLRRLVPETVRAALRASLLNLNQGDKAEIDPESRAYLHAYFAADVAAVEALLGRPTGWLTAVR